MEFLYSTLAVVIPFLVILTVLVFVHEMGHFLVARRNGVRVEVFSIGFGREVFGWTDRAKTRWKFSLIPLGGYVKMFGDVDASSRPGQQMAELSEQERSEAFHAKRLGQRAWIVAGGPLANFLFSIVVFAGLFMTVGQPFTPAVVGEVQADSAAAEAGFLPEDQIIEINGREIERFEDIQQIVTLSAGERMEIIVLRNGAETELVATPRLVEVTDPLGNETTVGRLGIVRSGVDFTRHDPLTAIWRAGRHTAFLTGDILKSLGQMIVGKRDAQELGGPILIAKISGQVAEIGVVATLQLMAYLSITLGLINLFPIPILDGGHLLFYAFEAIFGRPLGERAQEYGFRIGLALVLSLMVFATWNDIVNHINIF